MRRLFRLPLRSSRQIADDSRDELRALLAERVDYLVARGASVEEARDEALRHLGLPFDEASELLRKSATNRERHMQLQRTLDEMTQDLRFAARALRSNPGFAMFATMIVGLGIAASVTVFSVASALLMQPLPFREPSRLMWVANGGPDGGLSAQTLQVGYLTELQKQSITFSDLAAYMAFYQLGDSKLTLGDDAVRVSAVPVSQNFFGVLGVSPILGRGFTPEEAAWQGPKAVLLSHASWTRRFLSDSSIVGKQVTINGASFTVVGVLPSTFDFGAVFAPGAKIELFTAFPLTPETNRWGNTIAVVGRLRPGATAAQANAELQAMAPRLTAAHRDWNEFNPRVLPLREHVTGSLRGAVTLLGFAVGVVMLIVCANLSSLLLARATGREQEMAVRAALGAGRGRLIRQMLTESLVLSAAGAAIGLALAFAATRGIARMEAVSLPLLSSVRLDGGAVALTIALAVMCGLAFGLAPALQVPGASMGDSLRSATRSSTGGVRGQRMRRALVVAEVALACVLFVTSGLLIRSFLKVLDVDLGFQPANVATLRVDPDAATMRDSTRFSGYVGNVLRLTSEIPGVESAGIGDGIPLGGNRSWSTRAKEAPNVRESWHNTYVRLMSDGYVDAIGMRLVAGRDFAPTDGPGADQVIIINEALAARLWPGRNPLGKVMIADVDRRVIGVVGNVRGLALESAPGSEMYLPIRQAGDFSSVHLVIRGSVPPATLGRAIRNALEPVAPRLPLEGLRTLPDVVGRASSPRRFFTSLLGGFAGFSLLLALLGIYSVISYAVSARTREIGVRIALGATPANIGSAVIRETLGLAIRGLVLGMAGAWIVARTLSGFLFGVEATDVLTFVSMALVVTSVSALSGYLPARRAARIDPAGAMRAG